MRKFNTISALKWLKENTRLSWCNESLISFDDMGQIRYDCKGRDVEIKKNTYLYGGHLPIKFLNVRHFTIDNNSLTSLKNFPIEVNSLFITADNLLDLEGICQVIDGRNILLNCRKLLSLKGAKDCKIYDKAEILLIAPTITISKNKFSTTEFLNIAQKHFIQDQVNTLEECIDEVRPTEGFVKKTFKV